MITKMEKLEYFMNRVNCIGWYPNIINFPRDIAIRSSVPISYIFSQINMIIRATYGYFIDEYVDRETLTG